MTGMGGSKKGREPRKRIATTRSWIEEGRSATADLCIIHCESAKAADEKRAEIRFVENFKSIIGNHLCKAFRVCPKLARLLHWPWATPAEVVADIVCLRRGLILFAIRLNP
jgi:hypothetical protein